ncbi:MAG: S8 family serine peptidase [Deltaproteobacteria bacterium]|nr:MAG: S8 family serine peptidase [Deltaproteobacteria bacterium]
MRKFFTFGFFLLFLAGFISSSAGQKLPNKGNFIRLRTVQFDPQKGKPALPKGLQVVESEIKKKGFYILQFKAPVRNGWKEKLKILKVKYFSYIPENAYIVKMTPEEKLKVEKLPEVRWVGIYQPAYKIQPEILEGKFHEEKEDRIKLIIQVFADEDYQSVAQKARKIGFDVLETTDGVFHEVLRLEVAKSGLREKLNSLAKISEVEWIEEYVPPEFHNDSARWIIQSYVAGNTPLWDRGLTGGGQIVGTGDTGVDVDACFFYDSSEGIPGEILNPNQRKILVYHDLAGDGGYDSCFFAHGTHTAGTIAGDNFANLGAYDLNDGMAFDAKLVIQDIGWGCSLTGIPGDLNFYFQQSYDDGARIHSNSWGASVGGAYTTASQNCDEFMWSHKDFLILFSAGNDGAFGIGSPATAKDLISVGATENDHPGYDPENVADFSSQGPTDDGRYKPTIGAPGDYLNSAYGDNNISTFNCNYQQMSGTSMACPATAGAAALIRQYFTDGYYPSGTPDPGDAFSPSAALIKAILVNSGKNMSGSYIGGAIPGTGQGWGRILLDDTLFFPGDTKGLVVIDETSGLNTGETAVYTYYVDGNNPLEISLVWTDYPSTPSAMINLVNDLNLVVTGPSGTYLGNNYSGGESVPGGSADYLNVVENVQINSPLAGSYTIMISALNVPQGPQPYALVVTGAAACSSKGIVRFDAEKYNGTATVNITLADCDLNLDPGVIDSATVGMTSNTEPTPEIVSVLETDLDSGVFAGSISLSIGTPSPDGILQVSDGDVITVSYDDADDGTGSLATDTDTALIDSSPPVITNVDAHPDASGTFATITWNTDEESNSVVYYGLTPSLGQNESVAILSTDHSVVLNGLVPMSTYYFDVESTDSVGNTTRDDNSGAHYQFGTTPPEIEVFPTNLNVTIPEGVWTDQIITISNLGVDADLTFDIVEEELGIGFIDDMESGINGWVASGLWHQVDDFTSPCPNSHSPTHSWWYGQDFACDYDTGMSNSGTLVSPSFIAPENPNLTFWSWEQTECGGVCFYDKRYVDISVNGGGFINILDLGTENTWYQVSQDLSPWVSTGDTVQLRFRFETGDGILNNFDGWYIDDVMIGGDIPWLSEFPTSGAVFPQSSIDILVTFDSRGLTPGTYEGNLVINNDDPDENPVTVPVTLTVTPSPAIAYFSHVIDDDSSGESNGSGNGIAEPGEIVEVPVTLINNGSVDGFGITAALSTDDPYITINDNFEDFGDIPVGINVTSPDDFDFIVDPSTPCDYNVTFNLEIFDTGSGYWSDSFEITIMCVPDIEISPPAMAATILEGATLDQILNISNLGIADLDFDITELGDGGITFYMQASDYDSDLVKSIDGSGAVTSFYSMTDPWGIDFNAGYMYVCSGGGYIHKVDPSGSGSVFFTGMGNCRGLAFDSSGMLYASDGAAGVIYAIAPDGSGSIFASGLNNPIGVAFDTAGNLYVSEWSANQITKIDPTGTPSVFASPVPDPYDLDFDSAGYLYAATGYSGMDIKKISPDGLTIVSFATLPGCSWVTGLEVDKGTDLVYGSCSDDGNVYSIDSTGTPTLLANIVGPRVFNLTLPIGGFGDVLWLSESPTTGTVTPGGSEDITVTYTATDLSPGTYSASLIVNNNDPNDNPVAVPVTLTVTPSPAIAYLSHIIDDDFSGGSEGNGNGIVEPGEMIEIPVTLINNGSMDGFGITATLTTDDPYISIEGGFGWFGDIPVGSTATCLPDDFFFDVNASAPCDHIATFNLEIFDTGSGYWTDSFEITIICLPDIEVSPSAMAATIPEGTTIDQILNISNTGLVDLDFNIVEVGPGGSITFLDDTFPATTLDPTKWTNNGAEVNTLGINPPSPPYVLDLKAGDSVTSMTFDASFGPVDYSYWWERQGAGESPDPNEYLQFEWWDGTSWIMEQQHAYNEGSTTNFTQVTGTLPPGASFDGLQIRFRNTSISGSTFDDYLVDDVTIGAIDAILWLVENPESGTIIPANSQPVDLTYSSVDLAPGTYTGDLNIHSNDPDEDPVTVPVTLTVTPSPVIAYLSCTINDDTAGESSGNGNGMAEPGEIIEITVTLINNGSLEGFGITATLSTDDPLIVINDNYESFGNIPAGANAPSLDDFDLMVDPATPCDHNVTLNLEILDSGSGSWTDSFEIIITCEPDIEVSPPAMAATIPEWTTLDQLLTISNFGIADLNFNITEIGDIPWLSESPTTGIVIPGDTDEIIITYDAGSLLPGTYSASFNINNNDPNDNPVTIPITLTVTASPAIAYLGHIIDDDSNGESDGSGNGIAEPGEIVEVPVTLFNNGSVNGFGVTATLSTDDPYIIINDNFEDFGDIPSDTAVTSPDDFDFLVDPSTPCNYTATLDLEIFDSGSGYWVDSFEITIMCVPEIEVSPPALAATIPVGSTLDQNLTISNLGAVVDLDFSIIEEEVSTLAKITRNSSSASPVLTGSGGPDGYGYRWIDSDEPGGPVYDFIDIVPIGTQITGIYDDTNVGPFNIGFDFPFYGNTYNSFRFCTNGFISFTSTSAQYSNTSIPSSGAPYNLIAPFWDDLNFSSGGSAYYYSNGVDTLIISYLGVPHYGSGGPYTFQIILKASGTITYQYESMGIPDNSATLGIQNSDGSDGLQVVYNSSYVHDLLAVRISKGVDWLEENPESGIVPPASSQDIIVTYDASNLTPGVYNANLIINNNDPDENPVTVPVTLTVIDSPAIAYLNHFVDDDNLGSSIGNGNGIIEPGETVEIPVALINNGSMDGFGITATLSTDDPYITIIDNLEDFGDIPIGVSVTSPDDFDFLVDPSTPCDHSVIFNLEIFDSGSGHWTDSFEMNVMCVPEIEVSPPAMAATIPEGTTLDQILTISNIGSEDLDFEIIEGGGPGTISVAIFDHDATGDISYWIGGNMNSWAAYQTVLNGDPEGRFNVSIITDLTDTTLAGFDVLMLPDNAVPDIYLADVDSWFLEGKNIIAIDSAACYAHFSGYFQPLSAGSNGYGTYWNYNSSLNDQEVITIDFITRAYTVGDVIGSLVGDAQLFASSFSTEVVALTAKASNPNMTYAAYRDVPGKGRIIVLGPYQTPPAANTYPLIQDAAASLGLYGDIPWLSESPIIGTVIPGNTAGITVTYNSTGMAPGTYTGNLIVNNNDPDENPITVPVTLTVAASPPAIDYLSHVIDDDSAGESGGNANGIAEPGEIVEVPVTLINNGSGNGLGITATLSTDDLYITINDNFEDFGDIPAGTNVASPDDFDFVVDPSAPCNHNVTFNLEIFDSGSGYWTDSFEITIMCVPEIEVSPPAMADTLPETTTGYQTLTISNIGSETLIFFIGEDPSVDWLSEDPAFDAVAPGDSSEITVTFDATNLAVGNYYVDLTILTNDPNDLVVTVPVSLTVFPGPIMAFESFTIDDDNMGESLGDGDGSPEPGEKIELVVTLINEGILTGSGIIATLSTADPLIKITDNQENFGDIAAGATGVCLDDFDFVVDSSTPDGHIVSFALDISYSGSGTWVDSFEVEIILLSSISGWVTELNSGVGIPGATVSYAGLITGSVGTDPEGYYQINGLSGGSYTLSASASGYQDSSTPQEVVVPPDATEVNFTFIGPEIEVEPDELQAVINIGQGISTTQNLYIYNQGSWELTFEILELPTGPITIGGGPDEAGYQWIDSDDPDGPVFNWVDISAIGTEITGLGDDSNIGPFGIGFDFPFYGNLFNTFRFCSNGWISFDSTLTSFANQPIPNVLAPTNLIASFWDDLDFTQGGRAYYYSNGEDLLIVAFHDVMNINNEGPYTFEIVLTPSGNITLQYQELGGPTDNATVGIQNNDGTVGLEIVYNTAYLHDALAVQIFQGLSWLAESPDSGSISPGGSTNIEVVFDANGLNAGTYTASLLISNNDPEEGQLTIPVTLKVNNLPVITSVAPTTATEGSLYNYDVEAFDVDDDPLTYNLTLSPLGMSIDPLNGLIEWTPVYSQVGGNPVSIEVSDGNGGVDTQSYIIEVAFMDNDGDGLPDTWEESYGLDPDDPTGDNGADGDPDNDGITNFEEYLGGTNPMVSNAPTAPSLNFPEMNSEVETLYPTLSINNSSDPDGDPVSYEFELYQDASLLNLVWGVTGIPEGDNTTEQNVDLELQDNTYYWWRARAFDGKGYSDWMMVGGPLSGVVACFFVNTANDPPTAPNLSAPPEGSAVSVFSPTLQVNNSIDVDNDQLTYFFEIDIVPAFNSFELQQSSAQTEGEAGTTSWAPLVALSDNTLYYWRARSEDEHGSSSIWMSTATFFVNTANDAPSDPEIAEPQQEAEVTTLKPLLIVENSYDLDMDSLVYYFEISETQNFSDPTSRSPAIVEGTDTTAWQTPTLQDNVHYYWRVRAYDGQASSNWVNGRFFANCFNDPPSVPVPVNPSDGGEVTIATPLLIIANSIDLDLDELSYLFEVYQDPQLTILISLSSPVAEDQLRNVTAWTVGAVLTENATYYWIAEAVDEHGEESGWSNASSFMVNTVNDIPTGVTINSPRAGEIINNNTPTLVLNKGFDADGDELTYEFEVFSDRQLYDMVATIVGIKEDEVTVSWVVEPELGGDKTYYWRGRAFDGQAYSSWTETASFKIGDAEVTTVVESTGCSCKTIGGHSRFGTSQFGIVVLIYLIPLSALRILKAHYIWKRKRLKAKGVGNLK